MRTLFLDCGMGAAGDMLTAALYELLNQEQQKEFLQSINALGLPGVKMSAETVSKCGISGTHIKVMIDGIEEDSKDHSGDYQHVYEHHHDHEAEHHEHNHHHEHHHDHGVHSHHHSHRGMAEIEEIFEKMNVSKKVKTDALAIYGLIAEAESKAHNCQVHEIHFHEVGTMDAIADVTAVCLLMEKLKVERVVASPVHVGKGHVHCAHGILPVPAPATAYILRDVPIYSGNVQGELCTPTGAALLKYFVSSFEELPMMHVEKIGYGMGKKDFEQANCIRAMLGAVKEQSEDILKLSCNVDDMTGEKIGFAMEALLEAGAVDVYTIPIGMKKSRPGIMISVLCKEKDREKMVQQIFKHTTTLGIRENICRRYTLNRQIETKQTSLGELRLKKSEGFGCSREKYEYEDVARIAKEKKMSIDEVLKETEGASV